MKRYLFTPVLLLLICITAKAYDFKTNGIAYTYLGGANGSNVEVSYIELFKDTNYSGVSSITIPITVINSSNNKTYNVTSIGMWAFN